jgi:hypothetical protein
LLNFEYCVVLNILLLVTGDWKKLDVKSKIFDRLAKDPARSAGNMQSLLIVALKRIKAGCVMLP